MNTYAPKATANDSSNVEFASPIEIIVVSSPGLCTPQANVLGGSPLGRNARPHGAYPLPISVKKSLCESQSATRPEWDERSGSMLPEEPRSRCIEIRIEVDAVLACRCRPLVPDL